MGVKGSRDDGRLIYTWNTASALDKGVGDVFEVDVTPRKYRPVLEEAASKWAHKRARETTPERALRKMKEKIKRSMNKAARGEQERIVAVCHPGTSTADDKAASSSRCPPANTSFSADAGALASKAAVDAAAHCPALKQLVDSNVLSHLRSAYEFLATCKLHYCTNCGEHWPVFDEEKWPLGGVECAGSRAGECETINRVGWRASSNDPTKCSRCDSTTKYKTMYCRDNLQHLGDTHVALSNLTWYESLLIARVHPVVSMITMTATGMLSFAGHVINYFVKTSEWINELPARLRDKKWFLVKRGKSVRASGPDHIAHKKPTTANRQRLMAAIAVLKRCMPQTYDKSFLNNDELNKFPLVGELEMLEEEDAAPNLKDDQPVGLDMFSEWLHRGRINADVYPCADAVWRKASDDLSADLRRGITSEVVWEYCCRTLTQPEDSKELRTSALAALLLWWWESKHLHSKFGEKVFTSEMLADLQSRGKTVETDADSQAMQCRWLRLEIQKELETALKTLASEEDAPMELDVENSFQENEQQCLREETERVAANLQEHVLKDVVVEPLSEEPGFFDASGWEAGEIWYEPHEYWDEFGYDEWTGMAAYAALGDADVAIYEAGVSSARDTSEPPSMIATEVKRIDDSWEGTATDNASASVVALADSGATSRRQQAPDVCEVQGKPVVDPPNFGERVNDTGRNHFGYLARAQSFSRMKLVTLTTHL